ncbi:hypothetical protein EGW08_001197 [Elysia chlorotica]|uniref:Aminotransferase class I/classII large domain-containing protein n=1 Tax=Elysia chlorotica TaxID=188477 RepID=A0A3S1A0Z1_ELYCH|nr:hypothetical protein EGW08_001197 [Elysia chlorotica]
MLCTRRVFGRQLMIQSKTGKKQFRSSLWLKLDRSYWTGHPFRSSGRMDSNSKPSTPHPDGATQDPSYDGLSDRALKAFSVSPAFNDYLSRTKHNKYHPETNPQGVVAFGLAENKVAVDVLQPKLEAIAARKEDPKIYSYGDTVGETGFRHSLKRFLEHNFHPLQELDINQLIVTNGVTVLLENLAFALASPGEYIMIPKPYYYRLILDFVERPGVNILPVEQPLPSDTKDNRYALDVPALEAAYLQAVREGKVVRAIHITNPSNPTGDIYTAQELRDLLDFAHRYNLHVIANELYGLSTYDPQVDFTSILSLPQPDPGRVHFLWGFSKDFGLSGIRISAMYTRHPGLLRFSRQTGIYIRPTEMGQNRLKHLIDDTDYIDTQALPEVRRRMWARHQSVKQQIEACGGRVHPSPATIFRWLDLSSFLTTPDLEGERDLFDRLYKAGVHLMSGESLGHSLPGWFRMVAALEDFAHTEGMNRLVSVLNEIRRERQQQNKTASRSSRDDISGMNVF